MVEVRRVGEFKCLWGESPRWDDRRQRLYFVDAAALKLHWLDEGAVSPNETLEHRIPLPVDYPTALAFGGTDQDRLYATSVSLGFGPVKPRARDAGALLEIIGLGAKGMREPRFGA